MSPSPEILISQIPYKLPERAMLAARGIKKELGLEEIGVEVIPLRIHSGYYLAALSRITGVKTAIAGVTTATQEDFRHDLEQFRDNPKVRSEIKLNRIVIGSQDEPEWHRVFGNHLRVALTLGGLYLAMHEEPTAYLDHKGELGKWARTKVPYLRKNGWGPEDNRPQVLSWDIYAIRDFIQEKRALGWNIGTILAVDTALRVGNPEGKARRYDLLHAWEVLKPEALQIAGYNRSKKLEKRRPGDENDAGPIATLIQEATRVKPGTILTVEVEDPADVFPTAEFTKKNIRAAA